MAILQRHDYSWIAVEVVSRGSAWFASYTNNTSEAIRIHSVTCKCGTGNGHFQDQGSAYGTGQPIQVRIHAVNSSGSTINVYSDFSNVTAVCVPIDKGSSVGTDGKDVTWTFSPYFILPVNTTVIFYFDSPTPSSGATLCVSPSSLTEEQIIHTYIDLIYDANGGSNGPATQSCESGVTTTVSTTRPNRSINLTLNYNGGTAEDGSSTKTLSKVTPFKGWSDTKGNSPDTHINYNPGDKITIWLVNHTLYAVWDSVAIGTLPSDTASSYAGYKVSPRDHYTFSGWTYTKNGTDFVKSTDKIYSSTIIYASWSQIKQVTLTLDTNGGEWLTSESDTDPDSQGSSDSKLLTVETDTNVDISTYRCQSIRGAFLGWSTNATDTSAAYTTTYHITTTTTLYAVYNIPYHTVRFLTGYGNNDVIKTYQVRDEDSLSDAQVPKLGVDFKRYGAKSFHGWAGSWTNVTEDRDITAMWEWAPIWICVKRGEAKIWVPYLPDEK